MKYVVVLYDGMADYPVPALGGKTPMAVAKKPNLDFLAKHGDIIFFTLFYKIFHMHTN